MLNQTCKWLIPSSVFIILYLLVIYQYNSKGTSLSTACNKYEIQPRISLVKNDQTNLTSTSMLIDRIRQDPEAHTCYSLRSLAMPEETIDLNAVAPNHNPLDASKVPKKVTFNEVHSILYGDPLSKLIYRHGRKYVEKKPDHSYPHTVLETNLFISIIKKIVPKLNLQFVVEVGSFTGNSATIMGRVLKDTYPGSFLVCIDTWLGELNMWVNKVVWKHLSVTEDGRPTVYYQFLANIVAANLTDTVLPVSMTSILGARFLHTYQFRPQVIYLDSAHEQGETLIELALYWNILQPGGVLFGDDWTWMTVRCDVKKFMYMRNLTVEHDGRTWILRKPLD